MVVITSAIDSGDGVFIGGKHLHHNFKPMNNAELTLDQLSAISGGKKNNLVGFISEPDVGAGTNRKWTKRQSKGQGEVFIKDQRPSNCSSRLVTNVFPMGEW